jgi:glutamate carboxypeptidase
MREPDAALMADLEALVSIESPSSDLDALWRCGEALADLLDRRLGGEVVVGDDGRVTWDSGGDGPPVLLLGHHDTVWPIGTLARLPFAVEDDRVTGPGVFDMKAGVVLGIHAVARLQREGRLPHVRMLVTSDEEVGSLRSAEAIRAEARRAGRVLVLEPAGPGGTVKIARKGVAIGHVRVHGRAAHAGLEPEDGVNAAVALGGMLAEIASLGDPAAGTSVVPTLVRAGSAMNVVPAHAEAQLDVRFLDADDLDRVRRRLAALRPSLPVDVATSVEVNRGALTEAASAPLLPALRAAERAAGLAPVDAVAVGGASDGNIAAASGAYVLDGLGPEGDGAHADHEHVTVSGLGRRLALLTELLPRVAAIARPALR